MEQQEPVLAFKSHIEGKNATVTVWPDRLEYDYGSGATAATARWTAAAATGGLSLLKTGVRGKKNTEVIPMRAITSVTTKRKGLRYTAVTVMTAGGEIEFHVGSGDAERIKSAIMDLVLNGPTAVPQVIVQQASPPPPPAPTSTGGGVADELRKLVELRDAGILTPEEFDAQKAKILG